MASLSLQRVSVSFPIYEARQRSLKNRILSATTGGRLGSDSHHRLTVEALRDITLKLEQGDRLALIGHNGAGKTTLLRVMAGIYEPIIGSVRIEGRVATVFDVNLGLDPESTGYQNIHLRGRYFGLSAPEIQKLTDDVADFSELGDYLQLPMRMYSAGMQARLAFAVSTSIVPEILLLDESVAAGDTHFRHKAFARIEALAKKASIIVFASHDADLITHFCQTALLLERGQVIGHGRAQDIYQNYKQATVAA